MVYSSITRSESACAKRLIDSRAELNARPRSVFVRGSSICVRGTSAMLRIMLPCAAGWLLRRPVAVVDVFVPVRIAYVFVVVVVVDVDIAVRPFASVTPVATPGGAQRNPSAEGQCSPRAVIYRRRIEQCGISVSGIAINHR